MTRTPHTRISRKRVREGLEPAPVFVLCDPQMGENIGASARAMLNFGISGLRLVRPRDGWPNPKASAMAAGASIVIDNARIFETLDDAIGDCQYVAAATARRRELSTPVLSADEAAAGLRRRIGRGERCAVLFGGERNGLASDEIARADAIISITANPAFASINLAQAVLLVAYEWFRAGAAPVEETQNPMMAPAARKELDGLYKHLERELDEAGYFFPKEKRPGMTRNLRAAIYKAGFTEPEVKTLRGVIKALAKSVKD